MGWIIHSKREGELKSYYLHQARWNNKLFYHKEQAEIMEISLYIECRVQLWHHWRHSLQSVLNRPHSTRSLTVKHSLVPTSMSVCLWTAAFVTFHLSRKRESDCALHHTCFYVPSCVFHWDVGWLSGKSDCLSLYWGSQRLVTVGGAVIFVKYYKCRCWTVLCKI